MCNYYSRTRGLEHVRDLFGVAYVPPTNYAPKVVVKPTNVEHVVRLGADGRREMTEMRWGLVPRWAKDAKTGLTMFNARDDSILTKSSFTKPFMEGKRCLVPLDGFIESSGPTGAKVHHFFRPRDGRLLAFPGLWDSWRGPKDAPLGQPLLSYTFVTTEPNDFVRRVHDRMPVLLSEPAQWATWLSPTATTDELMALLKPASEDLLEVHTADPTILKRNVQPTIEMLHGVAEAAPAVPVGDGQQQLI